MSAAGRLLFGSRWAVAAAAALLLLAFLALPPSGVSAKANLIGYGICHQEPDRSYSLGGRQLPLCARDTGTYLGSVVAAAVMLGSKQRRARGLPHPAALAFFAAGFVFFAVDGINSYAGAIPRLPQVYTPDNRLRLLSGLLCGSGIVVVLLPLFNYSVWRDNQDRSILGPRGLLAIVAGLALAFAATAYGPGWLYYPLTLIQVAGVVMVLSTVNGLLAYLLLGGTGHATTWRDLAPLLGVGFLMMAFELGGLGYLRHVLEAAVAAAA